MAKKTEQNDIQTADSTQWNVKDEREQRKHNMWCSLSHAICDAFEETHDDK